MKSMYADEPVDKRPELLKAAATAEETQKIKRLYTAEQIHNMKDSLADISVEEMGLIAQFKEVQKQWKAKIQEVASKRKEVTVWLRDKFYESEETVYALPNFEDGMMEFYDNQGVMVASRKLLPAEKNYELHKVANS